MSSKVASVPAPSKTESSSSVAAPVRTLPSKVHSSPGPAPFSIAARLQGGSPLPPTTRSRMEHSFGCSFENVRVHTGGAADNVTREHHAEAVTVGDNIAFGTGRFSPDSTSGQHLIAHELAHVSQQGAVGHSAPQARSVDSVPGEPAEVAAESAASQAVRGERVQVSAPDYSIHSRVMRRALATPAPPRNPAPLRGRIPPPPTMQPSRQAAVQAVAEVAAARPERAKSAVEALAPKPEPQPANGQGKMRAQEQTEEARAAAKEAIEEAPAEPETGGAVPDAVGPAASAAAPEAVQEPPSVAEADQKEEQQAEAEGEKAGEEAKKEEGAAEEGGDKAAKQKAPASPEEDPAFRRVIARGKAVATQQAHNNTAKRKAAEAQAAAAAPDNEVESLAGGNQVAKMAEQQPAAFDKESFKAALIAKINEIAPNTLDDADQFKNRGTAGQLKGEVVGQVEQGKEAAQGPVKETAEEAPDQSSVTPKEVVPQPPTEPGEPPPDIGASAAAPKPKTEAEVSLDEGPKSIEARQEEAKVTDEMLDPAYSQEADFGKALDAKNEAVEHAETAPATYREQEAGIVAGAESQAAGVAQQQTGAMYDTRSEQFSAVQEQQTSTSESDTNKRDEITAEIRAIFEDTKTQVQDRLTALDEDVNSAFDSGAEAARQEFENEVEREKEAYKDRRYSGVDGAALWVRDLFLGIPDEVDQIYQTARANYISAMNVVIDDVATTVETGLNEAMDLIQAGKDAVTTFVGNLEGDLKSIGEDAATGIQSEFDALAEEVKAHEKQLVNNLADKYIANLKAVDDLINKYKEEDKGLVDKALEAVGGVIDTILQLKEMLLGVLAKAASVIDKIISDPIGFLGNLVAGIKAGLSAFLGNIGEHLKNGLMGWLFGAVAAAGIQMPETFDLKGLLGLGAQILGLTYANFRARAVKIVGEPVVAAMETAVEIFRILMTEGIAGVWMHIQGMLGNLAETVISGIRDWVAQKIVIAGITWILSLLNPASAFVRACKLIIDVIMFFVERGSQIMALVNAVLDSVAAIANGAIGQMASAVEGALAKAVPVAISFLASLLGLGGISDVIRTNIEKIQAPVNKAIDWLINKAVGLVKKVGGMLGIGGKKKEEPPPKEDENDPEKNAKVTAGLAAIDQQEAGALTQGKISHEEAVAVASTVKKNHPVFKSITVVDGGETWNYSYVASPPAVHTGEKKEEGASAAKAKNWPEVEPILGKPADPSITPLPAGYSYYQREEDWFIRREKADDKEFVRLGVSEDGNIVEGAGASKRISKPGALAKAVGGEQADHQFHHLIPDEVVRNHALTQEAMRRGKPPYNLDAGSNGVRLPANDEGKKKSPNLPLHSGSHPKWNNAARGLLDGALVRLTRTVALPAVPPEQLTQSCWGVESALRGMLAGWGPKLN